MQQAVTTTFPAQQGLQHDRAQLRLPEHTESALSLSLSPTLSFGLRTPTTTDCPADTSESQSAKPRVLQAILNAALRLYLYTTTMHI